MKPLLLRRRRKKKKKYTQILKDSNSWPVVQMAKKRDEFVKLVFDESYDNLLDQSSRTSLRENLEKTAYREKLRVKENPWKVDPKDDLEFWNGIQSELANSASYEKGEEEKILQGLLKDITSRYANEIAGSVSPSSYRFVRNLITIGFARLLNTVRVRGPRSLISNQLDLDDKIEITGYPNELRKLAKLGTIVMVPTHFSNLDSVLVGWVIQFLGLPPFIYGAGLNLFNLKLFAYFMNSLGAYKVDRRKKNTIYLETLKTYSTIALREGCHSLFFPGGTRSRSGKIEKALKLGLLGTAIEAQREIYQFEPENGNKKIFIVPVTINYHFVLEAPSMINDYLKLKGQEKYYVENDEFTTSFKISKFLFKFFTRGSGISVSIGKGMDVLGNYVNENGDSLDQKGNLIDPRDYFKTDGEITEDRQREQQYNRMLAKKIVKEFHKNNRLFSSHLLAYTAFKIIEQKHKNLDLYSILRLQDNDTLIPYEELYTQMNILYEKLKDLKNDGEIGFAEHITDDMDEMIRHGLKNIGMYHAVIPVVRTKSKDIKVQRMKLLYFYHNRLVGYGLEKLF